MKALGILAVLVLSVVAALITVSPVAARAAEIPVASQLRPPTTSAVAECPLVQPAGEAGCSAIDRGQLASISAATRPGQDDKQEGYELNDASGSPLQELATKAPESWEKLVTPW